MNPLPGSTLVIHRNLDDSDTDKYEYYEQPTPIDFNINEFLGGRLYRLTGIVIKRHYLQHYTTIAYVDEKEQWYNFNDEKVRPVDPPV